MKNLQQKKLNQKQLNQQKRQVRSNEYKPLTTKDFIDGIEETFTKCFDVVKRKNSDYANENDPLYNFNFCQRVGVAPARGILVRLTDKLSRISNLLDREAQVKDESIIDSIEDAINYLAILKEVVIDDSIKKMYGKKESNQKS